MPSQPKWEINVHKKIAGNSNFWLNVFVKVDDVIVKKVTFEGIFNAWGIVRLLEAVLNHFGIKPRITEGVWEITEDGWEHLISYKVVQDWDEPLDQNGEERWATKWIGIEPIE